MASVRRAQRSLVNGVFVVFCYVVTAIALVSLALILWSLMTQGVGGLNLAIFTQSTPAAGSPGGLANAIVGSIIMCAIGMAIAVAIGIMAGTWLAEFGRETLYARIVRFVNDILLSAPSVLIGLFVYTLLVQPFHGFSALAGGVALALIAVPIITRTTEDVLKLQPTSLRESGVALGAPHWTTIREIMWKSAGSGILTAGLLAFARISGETAPLLFTALNNQYFTWNVTQPMASLPIVIFQFALSPYDDWQKLAWTGALLVAGAVLATNIIARVITPGASPFMNDAVHTNSFEHYTVELPPETVKMHVQDVDFFYGKSQALHGVSMQILRKGVTAMIGPSGCGKSTLLRTMNRIYALYPGQRAKGSIMLENENVLDRKVDVATLRSRVGMVFQKPTPFPMSIYDNVAFGVRLYENLSRADMDARVEEALRKAALWGEVKDKLRQSGLGLSGGQQQRLCVARGIAVRPEVLLLDEPASALDPVSTAKLEETIVELKREYTIVIVTHNLQQATRVSDNTAFMFLGHLIEFGPTEQLFSTPRAKRTADYIGGRFG